MNVYPPLEKRSDIDLQDIYTDVSGWQDLVRKGAYIELLELEKNLLIRSKESYKWYETLTIFVLSIFILLSLNSFEIFGSFIDHWSENYKRKFWERCFLVFTGSIIWSLIVVFN